MDTLIGRLNHCCFIIPLARHFMHCLRNLRDRSRPVASLRPIESKYLKLWLQFLEQANNGLSINNIIYRQPTHIRWDDSCPIGIGGVSLLGRAYRFHIPRELQGRVSNNALEFLASVVGCLLDIHDNHIQEEDCILALTDNSSCAAWMHKSNFASTDHSFHASVAEKLASTYLHRNATIYSQHFRGTWNVVADSLSRDFHLSDSQLTNSLRHTYPSQVPSNFQIKPLPPGIISWIISLLQDMPAKKPEHLPQMPSSIDHGNGGNYSSTKSNAQTMSSSTTSTKQDASDSLAPLLKPCASETFQDRVQKTWQEQRAKRPWIKS